MVSAFASANINACVNGVGQVDVMVSQLAQIVGTASAEVSAVAVASASPDSATVQIDVTAVNNQVFVTTIQAVDTVQSRGDGNLFVSLEGEANGVVCFSSSGFGHNLFCHWQSLRQHYLDCIIA